MDILVFNKLTKPIYEGGVSLDCRPRGRFLVEVRRRDGTIRRPFGDHLIENTFLNQWRNDHIGPSSTTDYNKGWYSGGSTGYNSWLDFFYGAKSSIAIGSGSTAASATDTGLATAIRHDSTAYASGNGVTWSQSTGDVVYTIKEEFPEETGSVTYREAGIRLTAIAGSTGSINGLVKDTSDNRLMNRVVFPANVDLVSGETLILTLAITIPTVASTNGKTITISAQNSMNISGVLRLYSPQSELVGGTVTGAGVLTRNNHQTMMPLTRAFLCGMNTSTTAGTLGSLLSGGTTSTEATGVLGSFTAGQSYRDIGFTFGSGTPATNFEFRQLRFRPSGQTAAYQLLLDNTMTKASSGVLAFSMRFSV
jgi:hypothetical protein